MPYVSVFAGNRILTRRDLCGILHLDATQVDLNLSAEAINRAYRRRAREIHPDRVAFHRIPVNDANVMMQDLKRARDHLLSGEDNILGAGFSTRTQQTSDPLSEAFIAAIQAIRLMRKSSDDFKKSFAYISYFSNNTVLIGLMSTFANGQLNFTQLNQFATQLNILKAMLQGADGSSLLTVLAQIKTKLNASQPLNQEKLLLQLKSLLPTQLTAHPQFVPLLTEFVTTLNRWKQHLDDDFFKQSTHFVKFWCSLLTTIPSWKLIFAVYFTSLLGTAISLPKYMSAVYGTAAVIFTHKGLPALLLTSPVWLTLAVVLLPLNLLLQMGAQATWLIAKTGLTLLVNSFLLLSVMINLLLLRPHESFAQELFKGLTALVNITLRLPLTVLLEAADVVVFWLINRSVFGLVLSYINQGLDRLFPPVKPVPSPATTGFFAKPAPKHTEKTDAAKTVVSEPTVCYT